jgi:hypothetical protein
MDDLSASTVVLVESGKPLDAYVQQMRSVNTWGGAIEIRAFMHLWKRPVKVLALRQRRWIEFTWPEGQECKLSWTGGHYEAIL